MALTFTQVLASRPTVGETIWTYPIISDKSGLVPPLSFEYHNFSKSHQSRHLIDSAAAAAAAACFDSMVRVSRSRVSATLAW